MKNALASFDASLAFVEKLLIFVIFLALVATLFIQVLSRFVFESPLDFTEELSRVLLIWLVFVSAARGMALAEHFVVDAMLLLLPPAVASAISYVVDAVCVAFMLAVCWISYRTSLGGAGEIMPAMQVSIIVQTLAMPVGFTLMLWHAASLILRRWHIGETDPLARQAEDMVEPAAEGAE